MPHAVQRSDEAGEDENVGPAQECLVLERPIRVLVVEADLPALRVEPASQEHGPEGLGDLVSACYRAPRFVRVAVDDEGPFPANL